METSSFWISSSSDSSSSDSSTTDGNGASSSGSDALDWESELFIGTEWWVCTERLDSTWWRNVWPSGKWPWSWPWPWPFSSFPSDIMPIVACVLAVCVLAVCV